MISVNTPSGSRTRMTKGLGSLAVVVAMLGSSTLAQVRKEPPPLNAKIVAFAKDHLGEKVGNGQCTSLALEAMKASGAKRFPLARDGDYIWGEPVASFKDALPGDIVQFRDAVFEGQTRLNARGGTYTWHFEFPHHTAIIAKVQDRGRKVTFLHQNTGGAGVSEEAKMRVKQESLPVHSLQPEGKVWIYRPIPIDQETDEKPENRFDPK